MFNPLLEILPAAQRALWKELGDTPRSFVLYGGTAIALRLGHRQSLDFDFFSDESFEPSELLRSIRYLHDTRVDQRGNNTLSVTVDRDGPVKVSFFGDVQMNRVQDPDFISESGIHVASLSDLAATKLKTIQQRAEAKDYIDLAAILATGIRLSDTIGAASAVYGRTFNTIAALKALSYFADGNLATLPDDVKSRLNRASQSVNLQSLPKVTARSGIVGRIPS